MIDGKPSVSVQSFVTDIVKEDYRTAAVFRKYGIEYCCGARLPLELACQLQGLNTGTIKTELDKAIRTFRISNTLRFDAWGPGFLVDYIVHIHHAFLKCAVPEALESLRQFEKSHQKKYPWLGELASCFISLSEDIQNHIAREEAVIFPYIQQLELIHLQKGPNESSLSGNLIRPRNELLLREKERIETTLTRIRELTDDYTVPSNACTNHKVNFLTLRDIDQDTLQHLYLENSFLYPNTMQLEKQWMALN